MPSRLHPDALPSGFIPPCLPTSAVQPPTGVLYWHEIKHDGIRCIARKNGGQVRLYSRPGNDLTDRFSLGVETVAQQRGPTCISEGTRESGQPRFDPYGC